MAFFKCCKNKEFSNYICVHCQGVFHPSCLERKSYKVLNGYKVYCSSKCEELNKNINETSDRLLRELEKKDKLLSDKTEALENLEVEKDNDIDELRSEISALRQELREKEEYFKKERRRTLDFEDDVFRNEESLHAEISSKTDKLSELNNKMLELKDRNVSLEKSKHDEYIKLKSLEEEMASLDKNNKVLLDSLRRLEDENNILKIQIEELKSELASVTADARTKNTEDQNTQVNAPQNTNHVQAQNLREKMKKILVMGNNNVKGLITLLKQHTSHEYDINSHHADTWKELSKLSSLFANKFNKNDYVIIFGSSSDAVRGNRLDTNLIRNVIEVFAETNLIIIAAALHHNRPVLNRLIEDHSLSTSIIVSEMKSNTTHFLPLPLFAHRGLLTYDQKVALISKLCHTIIQHRTSFHPGRNSTAPP